MSIKDTFRNVFLSEGYKEQPASPIYPCPDPTTLFTCATISVMKQRLLTDGPERVFVIQPCLRTQNLKGVFDSSFDPEYLSSFLMLGTLCSIGDFSVECVMNFFGSFPGLKDKVLVRSSETIHGHLFRLLEKYYQSEIDTRGPRYYRWGYGSESLSGEGLTFAIQQPDGGFLDIGNLVVVYKHKVPFAVEFGFGLETFTARLEGKGSPYASSRAYLELALGMMSTEKRLGDCLIITLRLFESGVVPGTGKASSIMRKALRSACFLGIKEYGVSGSEKILGIAKRLSKDLSWATLIERTFDEVQKSADSFNHEVSHIRKHSSGQHLDKKINEYRLRYGVPEGF